LWVSIIFLRSPVLAIFAIGFISPNSNLSVPVCADGRADDFSWDETREKRRSGNLEPVYMMRGGGKGTVLFKGTGLPVPQKPYKAIGL